MINTKPLLRKSLIAKLNPVIRGWANYYSAVVSKEVFRKIDNLLWKRLWRWASRRHPNKSAKWVKEKYFPSIERNTEIGFLTMANIY
ncbi:group II intron maturase-specific domain-containing protein [Okeania sp. KiyG1]|uniref:group II intron maturase-specific domain-containing protein n=1 Tax=Okeania sp. KiyG1 TaxID=2720165 RepID=UPI001F2ADE8E|nr:group II intron maturase-specific domain-containing protein [Okeania sp. KiyG1]